MDKLKLYAKLFGGVYSQYAELDLKEDDLNSSEYYNTYTEQVTEVLNNRMRNADTMTKDAIAWCNSPVLDSIYGKKYTNVLDIFCSHGFLEIIKYLDKPSKHHIVGFANACRNGHYKLVKWLLEKHGTVFERNMRYTFLCACESGKLNIVKLLCETYPELTIKPIVLRSRKTINASIKHDRLRVLQYLLSMSKREPDEKMLKLACMKHSNRIAKWLFSILETDDEKNNTRFYTRFCLINNNWKLAEFFYKKDLFIIANNNLFFRLCYNNCLESVKWIVESPIVKRAQKYSTFSTLRILIRNRKLEMAKYLITRCILDLSFSDKQDIIDLLIALYICGDIDFFIWFREQYPDFFTDHTICYSFRYAFCETTLPMVKWVYENYPIISQEYIPEYRCLIYGLDMAKWAMETFADKFTIDILGEVFRTMCFSGDPVRNYDTIMYVLDLYHDDKIAYSCLENILYETRNEDLQYEMWKKNRDMVCCLAGLTRNTQKRIARRCMVFDYKIFVKTKYAIIRAAPFDTYNNELAIYKDDIDWLNSYIETLASVSLISYNAEKNKYEVDPNTITLIPTINTH